MPVGSPFADANSPSSPLLFADRQISLMSRRASATCSIKTRVDVVGHECLDSTQNLTAFGPMRSIPWDGSIGNSGIIRTGWIQHAYSWSIMVSGGNKMTHNLFRIHLHTATQTFEDEFIVNNAGRMVMQYSMDR